MGCDNWVYIVCDVNCNNLSDNTIMTFKEIPIRLKLVYFGYEFDPQFQNDPTEKIREIILHNIFGDPVENYYDNDTIYKSDDLSKEIITIKNTNDIILNKMTEIWVKVTNHIQTYVLNNIDKFRKQIDITQNSEFNVIAGNLKITQIKIISKDFFDQNDKVIKLCLFE